MKALLIYDPKKDRKFGHFFAEDRKEGNNRQLFVELDSPAQSRSVFELPIPGTHQPVVFCVCEVKEPPKDSDYQLCYGVVPIAISIGDGQAFCNFIESGWEKSQ